MSSKDNAFPTTANTTNGLTKREYIATAALQGLLANPTEEMASIPDAKLVGVAVKAADLLIAELNKPKAES